MKRIVLLFSIVLMSLSLEARINERDRALNKHMHEFVPVYCQGKRAPFEFWEGKYEFAIDLVQDEDLEPRPVSDMLNMFLGYSNRETKVRVVCNRLNPINDRVMRSDVVAVFDLKELEESVPYRIRDLKKQNEVEVSLKIRRDMMDIEVVDSGKYLGLFKAYKPARIFIVNLAVKPKSYPRRA